MTPPSERLPTETAGAVALAAVVGTVALSLVEPTTAVGTLAGGVLAATPGFGRSHRHVVVRSALVAVVVLRTVGTAGAVGEPIAIGTMAVGVVIGIGLCGALAGPPEPSARRRAGLAAFVTGSHRRAGPRRTRRRTRGRRRRRALECAVGRRADRHGTRQFDPSRRPRGRARGDRRPAGDVYRPAAPRALHHGPAVVRRIHRHRDGRHSGRGARGGDAHRSHRSPRFSSRSSWAVPSFARCVSS
ncbi:hypothetical protein D8S78_18200 [Natrialba swarupiae]|nr:hypothetical protein [Natrialba swarupiae]